MANCSTAYGTATLSDTWTEEMLNNLNIIKALWASWTYSIEIDDDFSLKLMSQGFNGCGRWAFSKNINSIGEWTRDECREKPEIKKAYLSLTAEMERRGSHIDISYSDTESGAQFICDGSARLCAENGSFTAQYILEQNYPYCWKEYLNKDFDGEPLLAENTGDILKPLEVDENRRESLFEKVSEWVVNDTLPGYIAGSLNENQFAELKTLIE